MSKTLGITVMPEWIQHEGIEGVLAGLARAGATAIGTSPYVMRVSSEGVGGREPPDDAGEGKVRLLDRPIGGKRELWMVTAPSFVPDKALYAGLAYQPAQPTELTTSEGPVLDKFIAAAKAAGLEVYLQVQAAIPPGYRVQFGGPAKNDIPLLPNGHEGKGRLDKNASLASPDVVGYGQALLRDLAAHYPQVDGFRIDWPEYPPYSYDSLFLDFSVHAMRVAVRKGYDTTVMRTDSQRLWQDLQGPLARTLVTTALEEGPEAAAGLLQGYAGVSELLRFKADLVTDLLAAYREAIPKSMKLVAQAFPPPWCQASGFDFARVGKVVQGIAMKFYSMHWPVMLGSYQAAMARSGVAPAELAAALVRLLDTGSPAPAGGFRYPEPQEPHPIGDEVHGTKTRWAQARAGACPVWPHAHGYGPLADVARRFRAAWAAGEHGIWVNRYGYLSDAKLDALGDLERATA